MDRAYHHQQKIKQAFDKKRKRKEFEQGDLVLKWDAPRWKRENTVNLMPSGSGLSRSLKYFQITLTSCKIWKAKKFLMAQ